MMDLTAFAQVMVAIFGVLGGQKGMEMYKRRRFANGNGGANPDRRKNSLSTEDKEFIKGCFGSLEKGMENDRLKICMTLEEAIRREGEQTRVVVRSIST
jgi:hypothetical protein